MATKTFPANYKKLAEISDFIIDQAEQAGFSPAEIYAIQTAVDEACSNIIDHAYGGEDIGEIEIIVNEIEEGLQIILKDEGQSFDPDEISDPDITSPLEIRKERGLGVFFMRKLMDKVEYDFSQSKSNRLILEKYKGS